jgi:hypothetical protein
LAWFVLKNRFDRGSWDSSILWTNAEIQHNRAMINVFFNRGQMKGRGAWFFVSSSLIKAGIYPKKLCIRQEGSEQEQCVYHVQNWVSCYGVVVSLICQFQDWYAGEQPVHTSFVPSICSTWLLCKHQSCPMPV